MAVTRKNSKQRSAILNYLHSTKSHPTADVIYANVQKEIPNISLGTVYRNLAKLTEEGEILRLSCDGKTDHYDGFTHPHCHFQCEVCGRMDDLPFQPDLGLDEEAQKSYSGTITRHSLIFYGICKDCSE